MLLAIDTSTSQGCAALAEKDGAGKISVREKLIDDGWQHGRLLISAVDELLRAAGRKLEDVAAFACGIGPGSYTGTRIGVIAAKTLAWSMGKPLYGASSLAALARSFRAAQIIAGEVCQPRVIVMQDARRDELYTGAYTFSAANAECPQMERPDAALNPEAAATLITPDCAVVGSGWEKYPEVFAAAQAQGICFRTFAGSPTLAGAIARAALDGELTAADPKVLEPLYFRREESPCSFEKFMK